MEAIQSKLEKRHADYFNVVPGVWGMKIVFVNVYILSTGEGNDWVLIDAGLKGAGRRIRRMAEDIFGVGTRPKAILLTHAHFDHVGALEELSDLWHVPIYAHALEMPYLKGISSYPPPDPFVGGGLMSLLSWTFPRKPIDMGRRVFKLPLDGSLPGIEEWRYLPTPGHSPGHISFYRESDKTLISGDAFVSTKQESAFSVMTQKKQIHGPPKYFTTDWGAAAASVRELAALHPQAVATGHGLPMYGEELDKSLTYLANNFEQFAVPDAGRYVNEPVRSNEQGVEYIPPPYVKPSIIAAAVVAASILAFTAFYQLRGRKVIFKP